MKVEKLPIGLYLLDLIVNTKGEFPGFRSTVPREGERMILEFS